MHYPLRLFGGLVIAGLLAAVPAMAQELPPARVGRVALVAGNIAVHTPGESGWSAAGLNYPVATGGDFWTDPRSRAQLRIGPTTIAMGNGTEFGVTELDEARARFYVPHGRVWLHIRDIATDQSIEIDIPQGAVFLLQPGEYDIDAGGANAPGRVAAYAGSARFVGGGVTVALRPGEAALLSGVNPVSVEMTSAVPDDFVAWSRAHDYRENRLAAPRYVSPYMTGYAELDEYGGWENSPQYGAVWFPRAMPADWAPYRFGHWVWIAPWGWTWVDREPWGFAPFHYGRWARIHGRWGWVPGRFERHPVYAPALVAFVGGIGLSARAGPTVGWFPLAPGEPYWPSYTRNVTYIRRLNVTSVTNITNLHIPPGGGRAPQLAHAHFANRDHATVVPRHIFVSARPVAPAAVRVAPATLNRAEIVAHPPSVKPARRPPAHLAAPPPRPALHRPAAPATAVRPPHPQAARPGAPPPHPPGARQETAPPSPVRRASPASPSPSAAGRHEASPRILHGTAPAPATRTPTPPGGQPVHKPGAGQERQRAQPGHAQPRPAPQHRPEAPPQRAIERQQFEAPRRSERPPVRQAMHAAPRAAPPHRRTAQRPEHPHPGPAHRPPAHRAPTQRGGAAPGPPHE